MFEPHDNADTLEPREGRPTPKYNHDYVCAVSGHIMDKWYPLSGPPKRTKHRVCVIPGCGHVEEMEVTA